MDKIVVLDFGSQYAHLICRRIREQGVYAELVPYNIDADTLAGMSPKGIIFSGGPASVYEDGAPFCDRRILSLGIPILGICYGHQMLVHMLGGVVKRAKREYGSAELIVDDGEDLFMGIKQRIRCWMSHGDAAESLPEGFSILAHTASSFAAAVADRARRIYGLQFHPEVAHTEHGSDILRN
ncbi:MAG: glutamine-hydrolyzing GMP synthase, partial [Candidatus Nitrosocaldus sp.]